MKDEYIDKLQGKLHYNSFCTYLLHSFASVWDNVKTPRLSLVKLQAIIGLLCPKIETVFNKRAFGHFFVYVGVGCRVCNLNGDKGTTSCNSSNILFLREQIIQYKRKLKHIAEEYTLPIHKRCYKKPNKKYTYTNKMLLRFMFTD